MIQTSTGRKLSRLAALGALLLLGLGVSTVAGARIAAAPPYSGPEKGLPTRMPAFKIINGANVTIGLQVVADNESNTAQVKLAKLEARRLGVKLVILYNHVQVDKQVSDFNQMIAQKVAGIVFYPLDPKSLRPSLAKAKKAGIYTFAIDAVLPGEKVPPNIDTSIISGRDHQAYIQVKEMARLKPRAKIVVIGLGIPVAALEYYVTRVKYWAGRFGLQVLGRGDNPTDNEAGGERAMNGLLGKYAEIDGVIAYNDPSALGANAAARASGRRNIIFIGLNGGSDGRAGVERGRLAATVQAEIPDEAVQLMDGIYIRATKQRVKVPRLMLSLPRLITARTIDRVPSWDEQIKALEKKLKK